MIPLTRLDGSVFYLNPDLIEVIEVTPDSVLKLTTQHRYVVRESADEIIERTIEFRRRVFQVRPEVRSLV
ncbi:MAG: flagellar FlbD family protein [Chloroflexi bacterium]|nr:flagellar FlbD family protein [Chloroflexota bacterium]